MSQSPTNELPRIQWSRSSALCIGVLAAAGCGLLLFAWKSWLGPMAQAQYARNRILAMLGSDDPRVKIDGAWRAGDRMDPVVSGVLGQALMGDEPDPQVREAYVGALGRSRDRSRVDSIEFASQLDPSGPVRSRAWLTLACVDYARFCERAAAENFDDEWQALGVAQGRLWNGDIREVGRLFAWARSGEPAQRHHASKALYQGLRPILDSAGRWPSEIGVREGDTWTAAQLDKVEESMRGLDLAALAADTWPHFEATERLRRDIRRINGARRRIAVLLFSEQDDDRTNRTTTRDALP